MNAQPTVQEVTPDIRKDIQIALLHTMLRVRKFEEKAQELFLNNKIPGFAHVSIGQEAVAAGVCLSLSEGDYITSTHRGHGHCIAKGMEFPRMFAELMGKRTGYCRGKGGSMHVADFSRGVLGANGIVGGGIPIATGAALSAQIQKNDSVVACFFGDGAMAQGAFHESLNVAALWKLPVIYVCENNLYGEWTHYTRQHSIPDLSQRALAYGIPGQRVDGMDALAIYRAATQAIARARGGEGPTLLECVTFRYFGHYIGDPHPGRTDHEIENAKLRDPIDPLRQALLASGALTDRELALFELGLGNEIADAVAFAEQSDDPEPESAFEDLFV